MIIHCEHLLSDNAFHVFFHIDVPSESPQHIILSGFFLSLISFSSSLMKNMFATCFLVNSGGEAEQLLAL